MAADMLAAASRQGNVECLAPSWRLPRLCDLASAGLFAEERVSPRPRFAYN